MTTQLNDIKDLEFINHDNDDLIKKRTLLDFISKTPIKGRNNYKDFLILNKEEEVITQLNNSEIINGYKLVKDLDPNFSIENTIDYNKFLSVNKRHYNYYYVNDNGDDNEINIMQIIQRKQVNEFKLDKHLKNNINNTNNNTIEPFKLSKNEQIEKIEKIESIKIDDNIPFNKKKSNTIKLEEKPPNFWGTIKQPKGDLIDRDASTKIKYENKTFMNHLYDIPEDNEKHEIININRDNNKRIKEKTIRIEKNKNKNISKKELNIVKDKEIQQKKNRIIPIELPSCDLEPEKPNNIEEPYIEEMRKNIEIEINKRKMEELKERKEKQKEKQKNVNNKQKRINGNVTVDIKGKIVYIRPIKYESLINEFKTMRSNPKHIAEIKDEVIVEKKFNNVKVIKNITNDSIQNNVREKSGKRRNNTNTQNNTKSEHSLKNNKNEKNKEVTKTPDRSCMKFASGSNFEIMNLECGVNLIENQKKKTGGKDYFQKYGRCSFEIFQEKLNRTTSGYFSNDNNNYINININDIDSNIKNDIKQDNLGLPAIYKKQFRKEKSDYDIINTMPNSTNNYLNLKTANLNVALNNLDLINEKRLKEFAMKNTENNSNIINSSKDKIIEKKDYGEINIFNKTLLKNKLWGDPNSFHTQYMTRMFPVRPEQKYLLKDINKNKLEQSPRKRLPPISLALKTFGPKINKNESGTNIKNKRATNKTLKELKNKNLSKDNIYDNKNKKLFSTSNSYYSNTEKGLNPIKRKEEI